MKLTARDISRSIVHGASKAGLLRCLDKSEIYHIRGGSGVSIPRKYVAARLREYRTAGVSNWVLEGALINLRFTTLEG